jgi:hypothetical protein
MKIKITKEFFMTVVPEWYDTRMLPEEGTLEERVCEFERKRIVDDPMNLIDLAGGNVTVEIVERDEKFELPATEVERTSKLVMTTIEFIDPTEADDRPADI